MDAACGDAGTAVTADSDSDLEVREGVVQMVVLHRDYLLARMVALQMWSLCWLQAF